MGPRFASLRHLNGVMAPALTDTRQTQTLRLTPTPGSPEISDPNFKASNGKQNCNKVIQCKRILSQNLSNITNSPVKSSIVKSCFKLNNKINICATPNKQKNNISSYAINGSFNNPKINSESLLYTTKLEEQASDFLSVDSLSSFIMNNSDTPMGDLDGNMGLTKSETESLNCLKEKAGSSSDVDQLFRNFQNVDEILQVIKSMESSTTDGEMVPMDAGPSGESEGINSIFPIPDSNELQSGLVNFDRELFTDEDVMNMCVDENLGDSNLLVNKETFISDKVEEVAKKQYYMERRLQRLLRRLHKTQARTIGKHTSEEVTGFLEHINETSSTAETSNSSLKHSHLPSGCDGNCEVECKKKSKHLNVLVKRLEHTAHQQALSMHRQNKQCRYFGSGSRDYSNLSNANGLKSYSNVASVVPKLSDKVKCEIEEVAGQLYTQLKTVEEELDSDITASSSGDESCEETSVSNTQQYSQYQLQQSQQHLSISKRASWRWAHDRAEVASKWTWLQAQMSDLDYRIRQHTEYHRQIRTSKRVVQLQGDEPVTVNGYHGADSVMTSNSSCRTRPLVRSSFGKRKLLHIEGLHIVSKKAARPATLKCGCRPPDPPCALCTGRPDPTFPRDHLDLMTVNERIALLDPAYHPVLSFPSDVSQSIHFEALMKNPEWQQKAMRSSIKLLRVMESSLLERASERSSESLNDGVRRLVSNSNNLATNRRLNTTCGPIAGDNGITSSQHKKFNSNCIKKNSTNTVTDKIKKLARGRRARLKESNHSLDRLYNKKRFSRFNHTDVKSTTDDIAGGRSPSSLHDACGSHDHEHDNGSCRPSPAPSPTPPSAGSKEHTRRKRENSYDIDNIVIPYSVASSTRVEKLQYKEILTPKWRILPVVNKLDTKNNGVIKVPSSQDSDFEDMCEETLVSRHEKCEIEERKKFSTYLKLPFSFGRTRHRRADSRAESSGANTPDPMSPLMSDSLKESASPITSPPATPSAPATENDSSESFNQNIQSQPPIFKHGPGRRRTISFSQAQLKLLNQFRDRDDTRPNSPVDSLAEIVPPYEPRIFPLPDEVYEKMLNNTSAINQSTSNSPKNNSESAIQNEISEKLKNNLFNTSAFINSSVIVNNDISEINRSSTPLSDSTESAVEEDPNDPEWTVNDSVTSERSLVNKR